MYDCIAVCAVFNILNASDARGRARAHVCVLRGVRLTFYFTCFCYMLQYTLLLRERKREKERGGAHAKQKRDCVDSGIIDKSRWRGAIPIAR